MQNDLEQLISVVDDDEPFRKATANLLKSNGFEEESFSSAAEFLNSPRAETTKCLILDIHMPGMGGLDLQRHLRKVKWQIPIIFITAYESPKSREEAMRAGAVDFLPKPFGEEALLHAIHTALQSRKNVS